MSCVIRSKNSHLSGFFHSPVVGTEQNLEGPGTISAVSSGQNVVSSNQSAATEASSIDSNGYLPSLPMIEIYSCLFEFIY